MSLLLCSLLMSNVIGTHFSDHIRSFDGPGRNFGQLRPVCKLAPGVWTFFEELAEISARLVKIGNTSICFGIVFCVLP